jgi:hypothetical protein
MVEGGVEGSQLTYVKLYREAQAIAARLQEFEILGQRALLLYPSVHPDELGGDSLLASRMITRMRELFELDVPIRLFFEASTVAELAEEVERLREETEEQKLVELVGQKSEEETDLHLAELQQSVDQR